jgi:hypothetical protein
MRRETTRAAMAKVRRRETTHAAMAKIRQKPSNLKYCLYTEVDILLF